LSKKFFRTDGDQIQLYFSKVELGNYITEQMSSVEDDEGRFRNTNVSECLRVLRCKARDVMSPERSL
jgi:hypothetical protein